MERSLESVCYNFFMFNSHESLTWLSVAVSRGRELNCSAQLMVNGERASHTDHTIDSFFVIGLDVFKKAIFKKSRS